MEQPISVEAHKPTPPPPPKIILRVGSPTFTAAQQASIERAVHNELKTKVDGIRASVKKEEEEKAAVKLRAVEERLAAALKLHRELSHTHRMLDSEFTAKTASWVMERKSLRQANLEATNAQSSGREELTALKGRIDAMEKAHAAYKAHHGAAVRKRLAEADTEIASLREKLSTSEERTRSVEQNSDALHKALQEQSAGLSSAQARVSTFQKGFDELNKRRLQDAQTSERMTTKFQKQIADLRRQLDTQHQDKAVAASLREENQSLVKRISDQQELIKEQTDSSRGLIEASKRLCEEVQLSKAEMMSLRNKVEALERETGEKKAEALSLQSQIQTLEREASDKARQLAAELVRGEEYDALRETLAEEKRSSRQSTKALNKAQKDIAKLKTQKKEVDAKYKQQKADAAAALTQVEDLQRRLEDRERSSEALSKTLGDLQQEKEDLEQQLESTSQQTSSVLNTPAQECPPASTYSRESPAAPSNPLPTPQSLSPLPYPRDTHSSPLGAQQQQQPRSLIPSSPPQPSSAEPPLLALPEPSEEESTLSNCVVKVEPSSTGLMKYPGALPKIINDPRSSSRYMTTEVALFILPTWFDEQDFSYSKKTTTFNADLQLFWLDTFRPAGNDISSYLLSIKVPKQVAETTDKDAIVWRSLMYCNSCSKESHAASESTSTSQSPTSSQIEYKRSRSPSTSGTPVPAKKRRTTSPACGCWLIIEMTLAQAKSQVASVSYVRPELHSQ